MSDQPYYPQRQPVAVPPDQPGQMQAPQEPSTWPTVIGIIAIVLGAGGVLSGLSSAAMPMLVDAMGTAMPEMQRAPLEAAQEHMVWTVTSSLLSVLIAAALLAAGIGLVKRRAWSIRAARGWALVRLLFVGIAAVMAYRIGQAQFDAMAEQGDLGGLPEWLVDLLLPLTVVATLAWGWAFPVLILIWLGRAKIKAETGLWG